MVAALKAAGHTVAMTGDGVNDVLALKDADIGVAMGSGSPVSRGVAQLVLLDDAFGALAPVIAEGRRVIANVERVANLFITKTVYATLIALVIGASGLAYPFLPRHLTIISDFTIGIPAFVLALLPTAEPFRPGFVNRVLRFTIPCGVLTGAAALTVYALSDAAGRPLLERRTIATIVVASCSLVVLAVLARPFDMLKGALITAMAVALALVVAIPSIRTYFAMELPAGGQAAEAAVAVLIAGSLIALAVRVPRPSR
jgi:cation-transporting ATPase E